MRKTFAFIYGVLAYVLFLGVFLYAIGFVWNVVVPKTLDAGLSPLPGPPLVADLALLGLFALQHSGMARRGFKRRWTKLVPWHVERSTYVLVATLLLAAVMWGWKPLPATVWRVVDPRFSAFLFAIPAVGWLTVLLSTFLIDHFHLFGLRQAWSHLRGRERESPRFQTPLLYRYVRHPLYLGFILAFWATPEMSAGHLLFAVLTTGWMLLAIQLEERDLVREHGDAYRRYRNRVGMLLPVPRGRKDAPESPLDEGRASG